MLVPVLFSPESGANPDALVKLGGNFGPVTTNGEWSRLVKAMFMHGGMIHFLAFAAGLFQIGLVVERWVGPVVFVSVYLAAGILASLTSIALNPLGVSFGSSGAVFGIYGLLLSTSVWAIRNDSPLKISLTTLKRVAPCAAVFLLHSIATSHLVFTAELVGFAVGVAAGAFLTRDIGSEKPSLPSDCRPPRPRRWSLRVAQPSSCEASTM